MVHRRVRIGHGAVTRRTEGSQSYPVRNLFGDSKLEVHMAVPTSESSSPLIEQESRVLQQVSMMLNEPARTQKSAGLLVGCCQENQVSVKVNFVAVYLHECSEL